jgi:type I restriction enzyme M protein
VKLTQQQLEAHLLGAANILRGRTAGQDYKNYILSLMFYKRLCDQWDHEADDAIRELEAQQGKTFSDAQRAVFRARGEHRFTIPTGAQWGDVKSASTDLGAVLTKAMRAVADSNDELRGVFTVDWNQPAPDGSGKPLIPNEVVHALVQHFDEHSLSNATVPPDVLGRAYEYLIKYFADDAGAKAGEFFTPPQVVDVLVRILQPCPGDTIYDPTCGSGGMLVHSADYLREQGHHATSARYYGQEMNWSNAAIGKINSVLHGLEADIRAGASTITDPQFLDTTSAVQTFSLALANFPFSDEMWWLHPEQQTDDKKKKTKLKAEIFGKEGYKDPHGRFGRGTAFPAPPASYGDYAFILHILSSLATDGRAGIVCPQGVLFRGQPEQEAESDESPTGRTSRNRKADDEYLIRRALLERDVIDAVIALPPNVFYGAGLPACLILLRKARPADRRGKVLLVYAERHFRELSAQNELRPQDVMRILVHCQAYGDADAVPSLVAMHRARLEREIDQREQDEVGVLVAEYREHADRLVRITSEHATAVAAAETASTAHARQRPKTLAASLEKQRAKTADRIAERDERVASAQRRADEDRSDVALVSAELVALYGEPETLLKHARLVDLDEVAENDWNLNVPRYVDTFEPAPRVPIAEAIRALNVTTRRAAEAEEALTKALGKAGYAVQDSH